MNIERLCDGSFCLVPTDETSSPMLETCSHYWVAVHTSKAPSFGEYLYEQKEVCSCCGATRVHLIGPADDWEMVLAQGKLLLNGV